MVVWFLANHRLNQQLADWLSHCHFTAIIVLRCSRVQSNRVGEEIHLTHTHGYDFLVTPTERVSDLENCSQPQSNLSALSSKPDMLTSFEETRSNIVLGKHRNVGNSFDFRRS